jgi:diaminohydroxyphosphoribosylaminopyrimidine deaminase/5-amino-6-(5-phosphoribosylamino)uracil reductase
MLAFIPRCSNASFLVSRHYWQTPTKTRTIACKFWPLRQYSTTSKNKVKTRLQQESTEFSGSDHEYMRQAIELAKLGSGHTYPNPPVGCILVDESTGNILGKGFHPRAGYPHAEIFALLEAAGHVPSGTDAAQSIVEGTVSEDLVQLTATYKQNGGQDLFSNCCGANSNSKTTTTAYVTLEPCCHYGQTPPCALSLVQAGVSRVVIGIRDPNPRVDGGGVRILQEAGITVDSTSVPEQKECRMVVRNFLNRITPGAVPDNYDFMTGKHRRALRALAGDWQRLEKMIVIPFGKSIDLDTVDTVELSPEWLEFVDGILWKHELVKFKLIHCEKKKAAKFFGDRLAQVLGAHVVQVLGHTMILYRPGVPPVLDLETFIRPKEVDDNSNNNNNNNNMTTEDEV